MQPDRGTSQPEKTAFLLPPEQACFPAASGNSSDVSAKSSVADDYEGVDRCFDADISWQKLCLAFETAVKSYTEIT